MEFLNIIRVMCETMDNKTKDRKFYMQTRHVAGSQNCRTNRDLQTKLDPDYVSRDKTNISNYISFSANKTHILDYFHSSDNKEADKRARETITSRIDNAFNDLFSGIGCFEGTSLQIKEGNCLYQAPPRRVSYTLQQPLKESWNGYRSSNLLFH